eukprot:4590309-Pleurochrysis_carterae.AAC.1
MRVRSWRGQDHPPRGPQGLPGGWTRCYPTAAVDSARRGEAPPSRLPSKRVGVRPPVRPALPPPDPAPPPLASSAAPPSHPWGATR